MRRTMKCLPSEMRSLFYDGEGHFIGMKFLSCETMYFFPKTAIKANIYIKKVEKTSLIR